MWQSLIANFAVVGLFVFGWLQAQDVLLKMRRPYRQMTFGVLMGTGAVVSMLLTSELPGGLYFDLRASFVAVSALLGGPLATVFTLAMAGAYRATMGGVGLGGALFGMGIVSAMGLVAHYWLGRRSPDIRVILIFALVTALVPLLLLMLLPEPARARAQDALGPMIGIGFLATSAAACSIVQSVKRLDERRLLLAAIGQVPDYLYVKDRDSRFVAANAMAAKFSGFSSPAELYGKTDFDIAPRERAEALFRAEQEIIRTGTPLLNHAEQITSAAGDTRWYLTSKAPVRNADGEVMGLAGVTRDITEHKALEEALREGRNHLDLVLSEMSDGIAHFDADGYLKFSNQQYRALFPLTGVHRVRGAHLADILGLVVESGEQLHIPADRREEWVASVMKTLETGGEEEAPLLDGRWLHIRTTPMRDGGATVVVSDITNLKRAEAGLMALTAQLRQMATTDALTGLINRRGFDEHLEDEVARAGRNRQPLSLVMIDIDRFKAYNDRYGHQAGDECLKLVAATVRATARRPADIAARYGGEEMALILPETDQEGAYELAEKLRLAVHGLEIAHTGSERNHVTVSLGVATLGPGTPAGSAAELIRRADAALYIAKEAGRDRVMGWGERHAARA